MKASIRFLYRCRPSIVLPPVSKGSTKVSNCFPPAKYHPLSRLLIPDSQSTTESINFHARSSHKPPTSLQSHTSTQFLHPFTSPSPSRDIADMKRPAHTLARSPAAQREECCPEVPLGFQKAPPPSTPNCRITTRSLRIGATGFERKSQDRDTNRSVCFARRVQRMAGPGRRNAFLSNGMGGGRKRQRDGDWEEGVRRKQLFTPADQGGGYMVINECYAGFPWYSYAQQWSHAATGDWPD